NVYERLASVHTQASQARILATRSSSYPAQTSSTPAGGSMMTSGNVVSAGFQQIQQHQHKGDLRRPSVDLTASQGESGGQGERNWSSNSSSSVTSSTDEPALPESIPGFPKSESAFESWLVRHGLNSPLFIELSECFTAVMGNMNEKGDISIPMHREEDHLLGGRQAPQGCTRGIFCKRCIAGTHENSRKRVFLRRTFAAMLFAWLYYSIYGYHRGGFNGDVGYGGGQHGGHDDSQCHRDNLVAWDGPSEFETSAGSIDFKFGKGNMATSVAVLTNDEIDEPVITITAKVTKTLPRHHDDDEDSDEEFQNEGVTILDANTKEFHHQGLHVHVLETDGNFAITLWADEYADHGHHHHHHDHDDEHNNENHPHHHHHHHHHRKFCANIEATIILPQTFTKFGRLSIAGVLMDVDLREVSDITFEKLHISTTIGHVVVHNGEGDYIGANGVLAKDLSVHVVSGSVTVPTITSPEGSPTKVNVTTTVGSIDLNVVLPQIAADAEDQKHEISITSITGDIQVGVKPVTAGDEDSKVHSKSASVVPGEVHLKLYSEVGQTHSSVDLADHQVLFLSSESAAGLISTRVSDKFLGSIKLQTEIGSIKVIEAEDSASEIEFEKNTNRVKSGRKQLKKKPDVKDEGEIDIRSRFGRSELAFE
ncbi:hypothetical protein BGX26_000260, partial [Mortierella sp. AD094]